MMVDHILTYTIPAAYSLLPEAMRSDKATAMLVGIGLHESDGFRARRQYRGGPAHGFLQFERQTVKALMLHPASQAAVDGLINALSYRLPKATVARQALEVFNAMSDNDTLTFGMGRSLLWTVPMPLVGAEEPGEAFRQYLAGWQPGAYKRGTEDEKVKIRGRFFHSYAEAWGRLKALRAS